MTEKSESNQDAMRFAFGKNWGRYLKLVDDGRIVSAQESLKAMLEVENLEGKAFLDVGPGSGLISLAARNLGARVYSFDYDSESVGCTQALKERYRLGDDDWQIEQGDALDANYVSRLGQFEVVYSWGVLHHTGDMWRAVGNTASLVKSGGYLFVVLYNDRRWLSKYWTRVKQLFNRGARGRFVVLATHGPYFLARHAAKWIIRPSSHAERCGMDAWRDVVDWLRGYPFEVIRPETARAFYRAHGFALERMTTLAADGRHDCNEYVFRALSFEA